MNLNASRLDATREALHEAASAIQDRTYLPGVGYTCSFHKWGSPGPDGYQHCRKSACQMVRRHPDHHDTPRPEDDGLPETAWNADSYRAVCLEDGCTDQKGHYFASAAVATPEEAGEAGLHHTIACRRSDAEDIAAMDHTIITRPGGMPVDGNPYDVPPTDHWEFLLTTRDDVDEVAAVLHEAGWQLPRDDVADLVTQQGE